MQLNVPVMRIRTYVAVNLGLTRISLLFPCIPQQEISKSEIKNKIAKVNDSEVYVMNPDPHG